jgi:hypothetical protein
MGGPIIAAVRERVGWRSIIIVRCASGSQEGLSKRDATGAYNKYGYSHGDYPKHAVCSSKSSGIQEVEQSRCSLRSRFPLTRRGAAVFREAVVQMNVGGTFVGVA